MNTVSLAVNSSLNSVATFCKFLSANDTGETGGHQSGIYISKPSISILFDDPGIKGENKEKWVKILWQNDFETDTRFLYYGKGTRNEYRITNFGRSFPYLNSDYTGALFILSKISESFYDAFVLNTEAEIEEYLSTFDLTPAQTNRLVDTSRVDSSIIEDSKIDSFIKTLQSAFPSTDEMSAFVRDLYKAQTVTPSGIINKNQIITDPDKSIIKLFDLEYKVFKRMEEERYSDVIAKGFSSISDFLSLAAQIMNRRKSRAGKSLEHHLATIFDYNCISYTAQAVTEGNKKPDFLFPSDISYHDFSFPVEKLTTLAAKTTCKDRWRQILNEADRLRDETKYLCTLQQGISASQLSEMEEEKVRLVVPSEYIQTYPRTWQDKIWTLGKFVHHVKVLQSQE